MKITLLRCDTMQLQECNLRFVDTCYLHLQGSRRWGDPRAGLDAINKRISIAHTASLRNNKARILMNSL
jgi:hypothetical protein